jgi:hypothetical protein
MYVTPERSTVNFGSWGRKAPDNVRRISSALLIVILPCSETLPISVPPFLCPEAVIMQIGVAVLWNSARALTK